MTGAAEFYQLAGDLTKAAAEAPVTVRGVVQKGALNVKNSWRSNAVATSGRRGHVYPYSVTYESKVGAGMISAEIGPETGKPQGSMGRGFEFGSKNQPPHLDGLKAMQAEEEPMAGFLDKAVRALL